LRRILIMLAAACVMAAALVAPASAADSYVLNVPKLLKNEIADLRPIAGVDILVPSTMRVFVKPSRIRGNGVRLDGGGYNIDVGVGSRCGGANACYVANFSAVRGEKPTFTKRVKLRGGRTGYWKGLTCGASCSPAAIQWVQKNVLYEIATKGTTAKNERGQLVALANSAIKAGPR
jgi:hypothetical protein